MLREKEKGGVNGLSFLKLINATPNRHPAKQPDPAQGKMKSPKKETATISANPGVTRAGAQAFLSPSKKQKQSESKTGSLRFMGRFRELSAQPDQNSGQVGKRFRVTLLQEGLGNFSDAFYYTPEAIQSAAQLYEGKKAYIDHPSETEEIDRPERSVKDILGYFENVSASTDGTGRAALLGDLVVLPDTSLDRFRALMAESISFSEKHPTEELVGLSINASGDFQTTPIDQFLKEFQVPESCKPKLLEAMQRGITVIRPVTEMKSAVSCDLVTTAGAGGEINQLLEGEKKMEKKEMEKKEAEKKEADKKEMEKKEAGEGGGLDHPAGQEPGAGAQPAKDEPGANPEGGHPDAAQDEELIQKMLSKYLGDGFSQEDKQMMSEMYQNAMEACGGDEKSAQDMAGHSMKMAKHMMSKQAGAPSEADAGGYGDGKGLKAKSPNPVSGSEAPKKDTHIESNRGHDTVKLVAEVARLKQVVESYELKEAVETGLRESKLPMAATKKFRETCLKGVKTSKEFQEKLAVFKEAFSLGGEADTSGFVFGAEKQGIAGGEGGFSAAECVET